jgi:TAT (twin-arginine translocation) pathway signal sequence
MTEISRRHFFASAAAVGGVALLPSTPAEAALVPGENSVEVIYGA